ncbi:copper resistance D family protein [Beijerinckia mobilis]|uniref:copper resistance D family protein n=1 Tax=Beijerinckia mobilis TaxID=231434 RepID=UPI0005557007|nr:CopD family protein [Beijerinckia mobilis]
MPSLSSFLDIFGYLSVLLRGAILTAQSFTFGSLAFLFLLLLPLRVRLSADGKKIGRYCQTILRISALAFAGFALCSLALNVMVLAGTLQISWIEAAGADFARADFIIAVCAIVIGLLAQGVEKRLRPVILIGLTPVILIAQLSLTHAVSRPGDRGPFLIADALHMIGAGVWIGGLPCFLIALNQCCDGSDWRLIGRRYSLMAMASVAAIIGSGMMMAVGYIGSIEAIYGTAYGIMVMTKVFLLLLLLLLGGGNFLTVEALRRNPATSILRLKRFAEVEIGIGITVFFTAASLTSLPPGIDLTQDRVSWPGIVERIKPQFPIRLTSPAHDHLTIARLQAQTAAADRDHKSQAPQAQALQAQALQAQVPQAYVPGEGIFLPISAEDIAWSEYNHHWAGVFVALIGLLALIEHFHWGRWARHWPLLFIVMAVFLFLRSDESAWPLGDVGFFASLRDPEVAQHRVFILLVAVFGFFEWRVRIQGGKDNKAALVFPLATALGGALLLTHSHAIANIKDELLVEMSHVPLALCGIIAGWARWLELRLDGRISRVASWVWPFAVLLVGLILLDYREA